MENPKAKEQAVDKRLFIESLLKIERRVCHLYRRLSERVEFPVELQAFWRDIAEEENNHRAFLEQTTGLLNFMESAPEELETTFAEVAAKIAAAQATAQKPDLSIDEALRQTLALESSELRHLDVRWIQGFRPSLESLLHAKPSPLEAYLHRLDDAV